MVLCKKNEILIGVTQSFCSVLTNELPNFNLDILTCYFRWMYMFWKVLITISLFSPSVCEFGLCVCLYVWDKNFVNALMHELRRKTGLNFKWSFILLRKTGDYFLGSGWSPLKEGIGNSITFFDLCEAYISNLCVQSATKRQIYNFYDI